MRPADRLTVFGVLSALVLLGVFYVVMHRPHDAARPVDSGPLTTAPGHYFGVAEANEIASYRPVSQFGAAVGRQPNIVLYFSRWGDPFQSGLAARAYAHGAIPFVQINPGSVKMSAIAAGHYDAYLQSFAAQVRAYGYPVIVGFAAEMDGDWDGWGWHHTNPASWKAAWRHVVTVFRRQAASNVTWLWTINVTSKGTGPIQDWWPGARYVTWVGIDGYYYYSASTFVSVFGDTINKVHALTGKPVLLSETGIGQVAGQARKIPDLFTGIRASQVVGFVWFDQAQDSGIYHQDWRLEGHPAAITAFRQALAGYTSAAGS